MLLAAAALPCAARAQTAPHEYRSLVIASTPSRWNAAAYVVGEDHFVMQTWRTTERHRGLGVSYVFGPHLTANVDFRYITSGDAIEHRWTPAVTAHWTLADFDLSARTRAKLRDIDVPVAGHAWSAKYLEKLMIVRPERIGPATVGPFAAVEPSYDTRYHVLNRWEERAGLRFPMREITTDLYGIWWEDSRSAPRRYAGAGVEVRLTP